MASTDVEVVVVGAGPAGLTAAYKLAQRGVKSRVLEADPEYVGGISRTAKYKGYHFDIGGHRFFSKAREVEDFWSEILPDDMLDRPRKSRIYYKGTFFSYPLKPIEALVRLGPVESGRCIASFAYARAFPTPDPTNLEDWVTNQFGSRLYEIFFKHYTEKVWGMSCREIQADWAAQRIKSLNLGAAIIDALTPKKKGSGPTRDARGEVITTLIDEFRYPRRGPGMLWEECARKIEKLGSEVVLGAKVTSLRKRDDGTWEVGYDRDGTRAVTAKHVICSAPLREVVNGLTPRPAEAAIKAANGLRYRDFLTVALILKERRSFDDNWIYIQDPGVQVGRIQNFKAWSPEMIPDPSTTCYGLEYFCFEGDGLWTSRDKDLVELATRELSLLGLARREDVLDGCVVRQPKAYPVYDGEYAENVRVVREILERDYPGLHQVGRNGMHRYNNQDHSMMTAMLTVENITKGAKYDAWRVNQDAQYIEAGTHGEESLIEAGGRSVPRAVSGTGATERA